MTGVVIDVAARADAAQRDLTQINNSLRNIESSTSRVTSAFASMAIGLASVGASILSLNRVRQVADQYTNLSNRIALVTGRTDDLIYAQKQLFDIVKRTRGNIDSATDSFNTFGRALKGSGTSLDSILQATEAIQKSVAISGSSTASANAAIIQLGQGLSAGALRGQELMSIMEQLPRVAVAIADNLNVPVGKLRELGEQGRLTSEVVMKALLEQSEKINKEFSTLAPTLEQSSNALTTAVNEFVHKLDSAVGISEALSKVLIKLTTIVQAANEDIAENAFYFMVRIREVLSNIELIARPIVSIFKEIGKQMLDALPTAKLTFTFKSKFKEVLREFDDLFGGLNHRIYIFAKFGLRDLFNFESPVERAIRDLKRLSPRYWATSGFDAYTIKRYLSRDTLLKYAEGLNILSEAVADNRAWDIFGTRISGIGEIFTKVVYTVKDILRAFGLLQNTVITFRLGAIDSLSETIAEFTRGFSGLVRNYGQVKRIFVDMASHSRTQIINAFKDVFVSIPLFFADMLDLLIRHISNFISWSHRLWHDFWYTDIFDVIHLVKLGFRDLFIYLTDSEQGTFSRLTGIDSLEEFLLILEDIKERIKEFAEVAGKFIVNFGKGVVKVFAALYEEITGKSFSKLIDSVTAKLVTFAKPFILIKSAIAAFIGYFKRVSADIKEIMGSSWFTPAEKFRGILTSIVSGGLSLRQSFDLISQSAMMAKAQFIFWTTAMTLASISTLGTVNAFTLLGMVISQGVSSAIRYFIFDINRATTYMDRLKAIFSGEKLKEIFEVQKYIWTSGEAVRIKLYASLHEFKDFVKYILNIGPATRSVFEVFSDFVILTRLAHAGGFVNEMKILGEVIFAKVANGLRKTIQVLSEFKDKVINYFKEIYDKVIGHSYWTDMIDGVVSKSKGLLPRIKADFERFKEYIINVFRKVSSRTSALDKLRTIQFEIKDISGSVFESLQTRFTTFFTALSHQLVNIFRFVFASISAILVAALFPASSTKIVLLATLGQIILTSASLIAEEFAQRLTGRSFVIIAAENIGKFLGIAFSNFIKDIPNYINIAITAVSGFIKGFVKELPIIGNALQGLFKIFDIAGLGNAFGLLGAVLLGYTAYSSGLLGALGGVNKTVKKLLKTLESTFPFFAGQGGFFSKILFGGLGPARVIGGIGLILDQFDAFKGIIGNSAIAQTVVTGGFLSALLLGNKGISAVVASMKLALAPIVGSIRGLALSLIKPTSGGILDELLLGGGKTGKGVWVDRLSVAIDRNLGVLSEKIVGFSAKYAKKTADWLTLVLFGSKEGLTVSLIKDKFKDIFDVIKVYMVKMGQWLLKNDLISKLWQGKDGTGGFKGLADRLSNRFRRGQQGSLDLQGGSLAYPTISPEFAGPSSPANPVQLPLPLVIDTTEATKQTKQFAERTTAVLSEANMKAAQIGGDGGLVHKAFFGRYGKAFVIGSIAAVLLSFAGMAKAGEQTTEEFSKSYSIIENIGKSIYETVKRNPFEAIFTTLLTLGTVIPAIIYSIQGISKAFEFLKDANILSGLKNNFIGFFKFLSNSINRILGFEVGAALKKQADSSIKYIDTKLRTRSARALGAAIVGGGIAAANGGDMWDVAGAAALAVIIGETLAKFTRMALAVKGIRQALLGVALAMSQTTIGAALLFALLNPFTWVIGIIVGGVYALVAKFGEGNTWMEKLSYLGREFAASIGLADNNFKNLQKRINDQVSPENVAALEELMPDLKINFDLSEINFNNVSDKLYSKLGKSTKKLNEEIERLRQEDEAGGDTSSTKENITKINAYRDSLIQEAKTSFRKNFAEDIKDINKVIQPDNDNIFSRISKRFTQTNVLDRSYRFIRGNLEKELNVKDPVKNPYGRYNPYIRSEIDNLEQLKDRNFRAGYQLPSDDVIQLQKEFSKYDPKLKYTGNKAIGDAAKTMLEFTYDAWVKAVQKENTERSKDKFSIPGVVNPQLREASHQRRLAEIALRGRLSKALDLQDEERKVQLFNKQIKELGDTYDKLGIQSEFPISVHLDPEGLERATRLKDLLESINRAANQEEALQNYFDLIKERREAAERDVNFRQGKHLVKGPTGGYDELRIQSLDKTLTDRLERAQFQGFDTAIVNRLDDSSKLAIETISKNLHDAQDRLDATLLINDPQKWAKARAEVKAEAEKLADAIEKGLREGNGNFVELALGIDTGQARRLLSPDKFKQWLSRAERIKQIDLEQKGINPKTRQFDSEAFAKLTPERRAELEKEKKIAEDLNILYEAREHTLSSLVSDLSSIGSDIRLDNILSMNPETLANLQKSAEFVQDIFDEAGRKGSQSLLDSPRFKQAIAEFNKAQYEAQKDNLNRSVETFKGKQDILSGFGFDQTTLSRIAAPQFTQALELGLQIKREEIELAKKIDKLDDATALKKIRWIEEQKKVFRGYIEATFTTAQNYSLINEILKDINISEEQWFSKSKQERDEILRLTKAVRALREERDKLPKNATQEQILAHEERIRRAQFAAEDAADKGAGAFGVINKARRYGVGIETATFANAPGGVQFDLTNKVAKLQELQRQQTPTALPEVFARNAIEIERLKKEISEQAALYAPVVGKELVRLYGQIEDDAYNGLDRAQRGLLNGLAEAIREQTRIVFELKDNPELQVAAQSMLNSLKTKFGEELAKLTIRREDTLAYQAGQALIANTKNSLQQGISDWIKGKASGKDLLGNVVDTFTSTLIDGFVNGFIVSLTGPKGVFEKGLQFLGESVFRFGGNDVGGLLGGALPQTETKFAALAQQQAAMAMNALTAALWHSIGADKFGNVSSWAKGDAIDQGEDVAAPITGIFESVKDKFSEGVKLLDDNMGGIISSIGDIFKGLGSFLMQGFQMFMGFLGFADGGFVPGATGAPMPVLAHGGELILNKAQQENLARNMMGGQQIFNINVTGDISRQTRSEIQRMIPNIATGVNRHNYEQNR